MQDCMIGFLRVVTALTLITGNSGFIGPVYPGNSGIALPVFVFWSSRTRTFGNNSPSITYSARARHCSLIVKQSVTSTASPRIPPAIPNSLNPKGVVGGSKQAAISMAGSTPILIEMGIGFPAFSYFCRKASKCRPGTKYIEISSFDCKHRR